MAASWTRRVFASAGLTQTPAGPHLAALQRRHGGGTVVLMIDVSGSMNGVPILEAIKGALQFVDEAVAAGYATGVLLWNTSVVAACPPELTGDDARNVLRPVGSAYGGNNLLGPLQTCHRMLSEFSGDRVVALFGDGDLTPETQVLQYVQVMKADNIRFVTRGLGAQAGREFGKISDEAAETARVESVEQLADEIAGMATSLRAPGLRRAP